MCDTTREDLLDMVTMFAPHETPFLRCLLGTKIPLSPSKERGLKFWSAVRDALWRTRVVPALWWSDDEDGWVIGTRIPNYVLNLWGKIGEWMDGRGYEQKYLPPPARSLSCDWLTGNSDD